MSRRTALALALLGGATALALLFAVQGYLAYLRQGTPPPFTTFLGVALLDWLGWAAFVPPIAWLARRVPFGRGRRLRAAAIHVGIGAAVVGLKLLLNNVLRAAFLDYSVFPLALREIGPSFVTYGAIVGLTQALAAARLRAELDRAELALLRMQLHPHFLFNTLHAIATLVRHDPDAAERMIARLGELLRMTLAAADVEEVPLWRELELLAPYLDIQRTRFSDRLSVDIDVDDPARQARVPSFVLQPLVENAIRHGIAPRAGPGRIVIRARRDGAALRVEVEDDGPGPAPGAGDGVGLAATRARLQRLYGDGHRLALARVGETGARVTFTVPA
ncbi:MAG TPA: histidine kinase [Haliangiales bacterium]|nr:histidine kinase [Haliangiales bacterium]